MSNVEDRPALDGRPGHDADFAPAPRTLSPRETQVLTMAAEGLTNLEVAARLGISVHAVKFHLASIYRKLGVANRTEAAVTYLRFSAPVDDVGQAS